MQKTLNLVEAASSFVISLDQSVITDYQIGIFIFHSYLSKIYKDHPLRLKKDYPQGQDYNRLIGALLRGNIIKHRKGFPERSVFEIQNKPSVSTKELFCLIDPFAYISHLSAMVYYKLSDLKEEFLIVSSYPTGLWRENSYKSMENDCGGEENLEIYIHSALPRLRNLKIDKVDDVSIIEYHSKNIGSFKHFRNNRIRVSTIGRTFLDMLRRPDLCGDMKHVQKVYKEHARYYLMPILKEIDEHGSQVEKVRAGYILEEVCNIKDPFIEKWLVFVHRGGSRKLDPFKEYSPVYSERWSLSLNI